MSEQLPIIKKYTSFGIFNVLNFFFAWEKIVEALKVQYALSKQQLSVIKKNDVRSMYAKYDSNFII